MSTILRCAYVPEMPTNVQTTITEEFVKVSWKKPDGNGSPVQYYQVYIKQNDGSFSQELNSCIGMTIFYLLDDVYCVVPLSELAVSPYNLTIGTSIYAKVLA